MGGKGTHSSHPNLASALGTLYTLLGLGVLINKIEIMIVTYLARNS